MRLRFILKNELGRNAGRINLVHGEYLSFALVGVVLFLLVDRGVINNLSLIIKYSLINEFSLINN